MLFNSTILILSAFLGGMGVFLIPKIKTEHFKLSLIFSGAYLFAITITHILPDLFTTTRAASNTIGIFVLLGFFMQFLLEHFTAGVEHGHLHQHGSHTHDHSGRPVFLLAALCLHAFLEGTLFTFPQNLNGHNHTGGLLLGISLHKIPAAFALMSVLFHQLRSKQAAISFLTIFALASPLGIWAAQIYQTNTLISHEFYPYIFALVCGNFLHISTTILFENSPEHSFNSKKLLYSLLGFLLAIGIELFNN
ncbi:ZIP family metal transporter [Xanthovirga aplysinae]|uniref:ZIP family metal transporter n=1 Tax=Xanthovirga aplysinae TaxID=2529853 RepID=UPI0012BB63A2|nr:ZIP family metal transporter [Xanthovirga aplysinae]MTI32056.1 zinc permease [Xanthovirga aplysinae]